MCSGLCVTLREVPPTQASAPSESGDTQTPSFTLPLPPPPRNSLQNQVHSSARRLAHMPFHRKTENSPWCSQTPRNSMPVIFLSVL